MTTPAEVAALRHAMGLSLDQLAKMLGVNPRTVRSWESGRDGLSPSSRAALWACAEGHGALTRRMLAGGGAVAVTRDQPAEANPPRGWYLAAAGRALMADPDIRVDWA